MYFCLLLQDIQPICNIIEHTVINNACCCSLPKLVIGKRPINVMLTLHRVEPFCFAMSTHIVYRDDVDKHNSHIEMNEWQETYLCYNI